MKFWINQRGRRLYIGNDVAMSAMVCTDYIKENPRHTEVGNHGSTKRNNGCLGLH